MSEHLVTASITSRRSNVFSASVIIEAIQWTGRNWHAVSKFCDDLVKKNTDGYDKGDPWLAFLGRRADGDNQVQLRTLEGTMAAKKGDWIIRGVNGEYYPCKPDIFEKTYERVEDGANDQAMPRSERTAGKVER